MPSGRALSQSTSPQSAVTQGRDAGFSLPPSALRWQLFTCISPGKKIENTLITSTQTSNDGWRGLRLPLTWFTVADADICEIPKDECFQARMHEFWFPENSTYCPHWSFTFRAWMMPYHYLNSSDPTVHSNTHWSTVSSGSSRTRYENTLTDTDGQLSGPVVVLLADANRWPDEPEAWATLVYHRVPVAKILPDHLTIHNLLG